MNVNPRLSLWQQISLVAAALLFLSAGIVHFRATDAFAAIVPPFVPNPRLAVYGSGVAEICGAIGLLLPSLRKYAAWGLIALLIAVFPANIYMATANVQVTGRPLPRWVLYARLPLQALLVYWIAYIGLPPARKAATRTTQRP